MPRPTRLGYPVDDSPMTDIRFEFATATRIVFGAGTLREAAPVAARIGHRACVVTGRSSERAAPLIEQLHGRGLATITISVPGEPTTSLALEAARRAREAACDIVIAIGGGSVLDTGKVIAALLTNSGEPLDYLEVIGRGRELSVAPVPFIAIPTTAGTGAEVTRNAVLYSPEHRVKASMRSPHMLPHLALVDPLLTHSMSPPVTATTGLDALTQLIEPYVSRKANPLIDGICIEGMSRAARSLTIACDDGSNAAAREEMSLASLFGGLALANAGLGAVHGLAGPLGGMYLAPHGALCACLLPHVMEANVRALADRASSSPAIKKYGEIARVLTGDRAASARDGIIWMHTLCAALKIPRLAEFGLRGDAIPTVVEKARQASSMSGNPVSLTGEECAAILCEAL